MGLIVTRKKLNMALEFSLNVSLNSLNSVTKNMCHYNKRA